MRLTSLLAIAFITFTGKAVAQNANIGCIDKAVRMQAEELKASFTTHGMEVYKDANVSMESGRPYPVAVQLNKGVMYQMIFVGNQRAKDIRLELFDGDDKKLGEKLTRKMDPNYIIYSFIPEKTDMYLVVLSQQLKNETMCSSFTIVRPPTANKEDATTTTAPSDNKYNNPRYMGDKTQQPKSTTTKPQPQNTSKQQPQNTNPRYVAPGNNQNQQQKPNTNTNTNTNYNNPRYKSPNK